MDAKDFLGLGAAARVRSDRFPPGLSAPAAITSAVEDVQADSAHPDHRVGPVRPHIGSVIMRRIADFRQIDLTSGHREGDLLGGLVFRARPDDVRYAVTGEGKLA